jgi:AbrB family looped-hinge helix DNA binding protein
MSSSTVTDKYQITIPKSIRNALNIKKNDKIIFAINGDQIILERISGNVLDIHLPEVRKKNKDFKEMREDMKRWRMKKLERNNK